MIIAKIVYTYFKRFVECRSTNVKHREQGTSVTAGQQWSANHCLISSRLVQASTGQ